MSEELFSLLFCSLLLFNTTEAISFLSQPKSIEYVECGADLDLKWVCNNTEAIDSITWYAIGNTELKIASYVPNIGFSIIKNANYLPIKESRFTYVPVQNSTWVKIGSVKLEDESQIKLIVDFNNLQSLQNIITIKVIVSPVPTETLLPTFTFGEFEANSVRFVCTFKSLPKPEVLWFGNGKKLEFDPYKSVIVNNPKGVSLCSSYVIESTLVLTNIDLEDSQNISCSTSILTYNQITSMQSTNFKVGYKPGRFLPSLLKFSDTSVSGGSYSNLTCKADAIPLPTFEVYRDSYFLVSGTADNTGSFVHTIGPVKFYDDGIYTCKITNMYGAENLTVVLNVTIMPQFWGDNLSDIKISLADSLNIPCRIYGDPLLQNSKWTKIYGQKSDFAQEITETFSNKTVSFRINNLHIEKTILNDSGVYQCIGYNFLGNVTMAVHVQFISISFFSQPKSIEYVECGADLDLKWVYDYNQTIDSITWYAIGNTELKIASYVPNTGFSIIKNANYLPIKESRFTYVPVKNSTWVKISSVKLEDESQIKVIVDFVNLQSLQNIITIKVIVSPVPTETLLPTFTFGEMEANVSFVCAFKSLPKPEVLWFGNGKKFEFDPYKSVIVNNSKGVSLCNSYAIESTLVLMNVSLGDSQNISCSTSILTYNQITSMQSTTFKVGYKPGRLFPSSLKFSDTSVSVGSYSNLICKADAIPLPIFEVYRDSNFLVSSTANYTGSFIYTVGPVKFSDEGTYACKIKNMYGAENLTVVLNVTAISFFSQPKSIEYVECGADLDLKWVYDYIQTIDSITWYAIGNTELKIASYVPNIGFSIIKNASYLPIKESRFSYISVQNSAWVKISSVKFEDESQIKVIVDFINLQSLQNIITIKVIVSPVPTETLLPTFTFGEMEANVSFVCTFKSLPKPEVLWFGNGKKFEFNSYKSAIVNNPKGVSLCNSYAIESTLVLINVSLGDSQNIFCSTSILTYNQITSMQSTTFKVGYKPGRLTPSSLKFTDSSVAGGSFSNLTCKADAIPLPTFEVYRDNYFLVSGTADNTGSFVHTVGPVKFYDDGIYTCKIKNMYGTENLTVALNVIVMPQFWGDNLSDITISLGDSLNISCCIYGDPLLQNSMWTKIYGQKTNFVQEITEIFSNKTVSFRTNNLHIEKTILNDSGVYQCIGYNFLGNVTVAVNVKLIYKPFVYLTSNVSTIIIDGLQAVSVHMDTFLELTCIVQGYDLMTVKWYRDNISISNQVNFGLVERSGDSGYIQSSSLLIRSSLNENFKIYKCVLNTSAGEIESLLKIYVLYGKITKPLGGTICSQFQTDAFLDWQIFYSQPISTVKWTMLNEDGSEKFIVGKLTNRNVVSASMKSFHYEYDIETIVGLYIRNISFGDEGWYSVVIDFMNSPYLMEAKAYLCVSRPPFLMVNNETQYVDVSDKVELTCRSYGDPSIQLHWLLPKFLTNISFKNEMIYQNISFVMKITSATIQSAEIRHSGVYGCMANNSFYYIAKNITLNVRYSPETFLSSNITIKERELAYFSCLSEGQPIPILKWLLNNKTVLTNNEKVRIATNTISNVFSGTVNSSLSIDSVSRNDYAGEIACVAENSLNSVTKTAFLNVQYPPDWKDIYNPVYVEQKRLMVLDCYVNANPPASYKWLINGTAIDYNDSNYVVNSAYFNDEGNYICLPSNYLGSPGIILFTVFMLVPPKDINVTCESTDPVYGDKMVTCICTGYGRPAPEFFWTRKDDPNKTILSSSQVLKIGLPYTHSDAFVCHMKNRAGTLSSFLTSVGYLVDDKSYGYLLYILIPLFAIGAIFLMFLICKNKS